jgi:EAL domain-containing protein (putative c-di-GMP-specific phosphodiesterase class I)
MLGTRTTRLPDCRPLLADPDDLTLVFQPIVDLAAATVAGYEALARFPGSAGPDVWFAAAAEAGLAAELEALAIHKALAAVPSLPPTRSSRSTSARTSWAPPRSRTRSPPAPACSASSSS